MWSRRQFLGSVAAGTLAGSMTFDPARSLRAADQQGVPKKKLAVVTTLWNYRSHAWHMAERFLTGYPLQGAWHQPPFQVVGAYVDQRPEGDLSQKRADEFGFRVYPTVAEALRAGGSKLAVDGILLIGEHGDYPVNEFGQKQYPRYELFQQIVKVFAEDGRAVPVFNDKHLSWNFDWAREMVQSSQKLGFPLLAGSSLPVTWRMPSIEMKTGAKVEEALVVAYGPTDIYDFHALETLQCMLERREQGETGVAAVEALKGEAVWKLLAQPEWSRGGCDPKLFEACLSRSQTLTQPESFSHRYPTVAQMRAFTKEPVAYRIEYADGTRATMLQLNGLVEDFTFAARLKDSAKPISTLFYLPPNPNVVYSAALMSNVERMLTTGKAPYPVERTLLTSGLVQACLQSLKKGTRLETPHLKQVHYQPSAESTFWQS